MSLTVVSARWGYAMEILVAPTALSLLLAISFGCLSRLVFNRGRYRGMREAAAEIARNGVALIKRFIHFLHFWPMLASWSKNGLFHGSAS